MNDTLIAIVQNPTNSNGVSYDTIFTTFITIAIFVIGYIVNRIIESKKEKLRLADLKEYFLFKFASFQPLIDKQITGYKELSLNIKKNKCSDFILAESIDSSIINYSSLPFNDFYKIFISNGNPKSHIKYEKYNDLVVSLNFIERQIEYAKNNFTLFFNDYHRFENDWETNVDTIFRLYDQILSFTRRYNIDVNNDLFLLEFGSFLNNWQKKCDPYDISNSELELLEPLKNICKKYLEDERAIQILHVLIKASRAVLNLNKLKSIFSEYYDREAIKLQEQKDKLNLSIEYYS